MRRFLKKAALWTYIQIHSWIIRISIGLYNTEIDVLKADTLGLDSKTNKIQRHRHRNQLLEKFYAGQRDEKYVKDYYELLKKGDKFMRNATAHKMEVAAYKHGTNYGMKDRYGRRYEHYGFFDDKHKHAGKTLKEVIELEMDERRTKDDEYKLLYVFSNHPIEKGVGGIEDIVEKVGDDEYIVIDIQKKSKQFVFPIKPIRRTEKEVVNKIEQLTEFLHVKHVGFEYVQLEFFIPLKFKTKNIDDGSDVFNDLVNIDGVYIYDEYGESKWFGINKYEKRIIYNDTHEVWKFGGIEMEKI